MRDSKKARILEKVAAGKKKSTMGPVIEDPGQDDYLNELKRKAAARVWDPKKAYPVKAKKPAKKVALKGPAHASR